MHNSVAIRLAVGLACGSCLLFAQVSGSMEGRVVDPQKAPVPGVTLTILETATGTTRTTLTGEEGWFVVPFLAPGLYELEARHKGFRPEVHKGVWIEAGRTSRLELLLQIGGQKESLVVVAPSQPVSTSPGDWGESLSEGRLRSLPLNGRDLFDLASQLPGVHVATTSPRTVTTGRGARISVNGSRPNQNGFRLDGIYINDATGSSPASAGGALLGLEAVQELHLVTSPFDAEYGRAAGALLTAVSKSGSNAWRGSAYEYLRNSALDARNFFDAPGEPVPPLRQNQFGGLLSGPIRKNRLFFLANYEGVRQITSRTRRSITPNAEARQGRLPGRTVSVSPAIQPYLDLYPLPNGADYGDGTGEFISVVRSAANENLFTVKTDWIPIQHVRYAGRYSFDQGALSWPDPFLIWTFRDTSRYHFAHNQLEFFHTPVTIHSFRAGFSRVWNSQDSSQPGSVPAALSFIPGMPLGNINYTTSLSSLGGDRGASLAQLPRRYVLNDFQFSYAATLVRGSHLLKAGASFDRIQFNQRADLSSKGTYTFSSLAELLQGLPRSGRLMLPGTDTIRGWRQSLVAGYVQDQWRVTSRLGVTAGVRYETYSTPSEVNGKVATFPGDFFASASTATGGPLFHNPSRWNFAPRASLAYALTPSGHTVLRAGGGLFYDLIGSRELAVAGSRVPPFFLSANLNRPSFPNLLQAATNAQPERSLDMLDYHLLQPYVAQYQVQIQTQLPLGAVAQVGYAGSRGVHLIGFVGEYNPNRPEVLPDGRLFFPAALNRLNPAFGTTAMRRSQFDSSYHALQAWLSKSLQQGIRFQVKYTFGKALDTVSNVIRNDFTNYGSVPTMFHYRLNRGRSDFDVNQMFAANVSWLLPERGRGPAAWILHGWELHLMLQAQSGPPFNPTVGFDRARLSGGTTTDLQQRPDFLGPAGRKLILGSPQRWFDPEAFGLPAAGMYGNLGRNTLTGPGLAALDAALHKTLLRRENHSLRLRAEAFNVTNHPNFQIPSTVTLFDSSLNRVGAAGQITATTTPARQVQLALRYEF